MHCQEDSNNNTSYEENYQGKEITFNDLVAKLLHLYGFLLSKWLLISFIAMLGSLLGIVYSIYDKPVYKAELNFVVEDDKMNGGLGGALGLVSQLGIDIGGGGGGAFSGDNLLQLLKSRALIERTLLSPFIVDNKNITLAEYYVNFSNYRSAWETASLKNIHFVPSQERNKFSIQQDSVLGELYEYIVKKELKVFREDKTLNIVSIDYNSKNEIFSKLFPEVLIKVAADFYIETKTQKAARNVLVLQHQTDSVRRELNKAITGIAYSNDANPNPNPSRQILRVPSQRRQVDVQANTAILGELVKNLEISKVSLRRETPLIQVIDRPILPLKTEKISLVKGAIIGGFLFGLLSVIFFTLKRIKTR